MPLSSDEKLELRDIIRQEVADQNRITADFLQQNMRADIQRIVDGAKAEILNAVGQSIDDGILPQIDDHEQRITTLEQGVKV